MVAVRELASVDGPDGRAWDGLVEVHPAATFFHRVGWKRAVEGALGHRSPYLIAERNGALAGVLPLTCVRSRLFGRRVVSAPFGVHGGPIAEDDAAERALLEEARRRAEVFRAASLEYRCALPTAPARHGVNGEHANFAKPIEPDADANLKAIPRKQRAMVRKGINQGLSSRLDADIDVCYRVYAESVRNLGTPVFPKSLFRALRSVFERDSEVTTVLDPDGQPVAAVLSFFFRDRVLPYYGGGLPAARDLAANDFMYWEVMRRAGEGGYRVFDFGRSKVGSGAYAFKKNWGFPPEPLTYTHELVASDQAPDLSPNNPKFQRMIRVWQRLPLGVANTLGPWIAKDLA